MTNAAPKPRPGGWVWLWTGLTSVLVVGAVAFPFLREAFAKASPQPLPEAPPPKATVEPGRDGLIRGALRVLGTSRRTANLPPDAAYQLIRWDSGRVTLSDEATGAEVPLDAFGPHGAGGTADLMALVGPPEDRPEGRPEGPSEGSGN